MDTKIAIDAVLQGLQTLVLSNLQGAAHEQYFPRRDPDNSDDYIKERKERVATLRRLREEFENTVTGIL